MTNTKRNSGSQDDILKSYFQQIKKAPLLSFEEELELSKKIQNGDEMAKQKLINSNLRLVVKIAKGYIVGDISFLDLIQEGNLGLIKAASMYDYRKEVRFSTYAAWWIRQSIVRALSNKRRTIRLPHRKEETLKRIQSIYYTLTQKLSRKPTMEEIAEEMNMDPHEVFSIMNISGSTVSLDSEQNFESGNLHDMFEDYSYNPDRQLMQNSMREETLKFLEHLLEREKKILMYRFAFYGGKKYTLKRIGEEMGISPETVRQIEIRAIKKLRSHADEVREYMYN